MTEKNTTAPKRIALHPKNVYTLPLHRDATGRIKPKYYADHEDLGGVTGLTLAVRPSTKKGVTDPDAAALRYWVHRYTYNGKTHAFNLGKLAKKIRGLTFGLTLADARTEVVRQRHAMITEGVYPHEERDKVEAEVMTFGKIAAEYIDNRDAGWSNEKHAAQWRATFDPDSPAGYAADLIDLPVASIKPVDVYNVLTRTRTDRSRAGNVLTVTDPETGKKTPKRFSLWTGKHDSAKKVLGRIRKVLGHAVKLELIPSNPADPERLPDLPDHNGVEKHFAALPWQEVPELMAQLTEKAEAGETRASALAFLILTGVRTSDILFRKDRASGELYTATLDELDREAMVWNVEADRMKKRKGHSVPLTPAMLKIIDAVERPVGSRVLFPGTSEAGTITKDSMRTLLQKTLGYKKATPHGMRATFTNFAADNSGSWTETTADRALAHVEKDKVKRAYNRTDQLEKRRELMTAWSDFATSTPAETVASING